MDPRQRRAVAEQTRAAVIQLAQRLRAERPPDALSSNKIAVLAYLHRHGTGSPGEIAASARQQPQSLTRVFAELAEAGLVRRTPNARDRRGAVLTLTEAGILALRRDMSHRDRWLADAFEDLSDQDVAALAHAARVMARLAEE